MKIFPHPLTFKLPVSLYSKWVFIDIISLGYVFKSILSIFLLTGVSRPFTFWCLRAYVHHFTFCFLFVFHFHVFFFLPSCGLLEHFIIIQFWFICNAFECMYLLSIFGGCSRYHFLYVQRTSSGHSFRIGMLVRNSFSFPSSESVFISPSFLKDIFTGCRILYIGNSFLSALEKILCYFFWAPVVSGEKFTVVWIVLSHG